MQTLGFRHSRHFPIQRGQGRRPRRFRRSPFYRFMRRLRQILNQRVHL
jgi:hypothetical protein